MYIHLYRPRIHAHTRRINMTISSFRKHLIPSLAVASAAFFGGTAGARAADLTSTDPQEQARQLLAPTTHTVRPAALSGSSMPSGAERALDPQELARRLLAGAHSAGYNEMAATAVNTVPADRNASLGDGQALAQRMILMAQSTAKTRAVTTAATAAHSRAVLQ
jgi:hypothetical protein